MVGKVMKNEFWVKEVSRQPSSNRGHSVLQGRGLRGQGAVWWSMSESLTRILSSVLFPTTSQILSSDHHPACSCRQTAAILPSLALRLSITFLPPQSAQPSDSSAARHTQHATCLFLVPTPARIGPRFPPQRHKLILRRCSPCNTSKLSAMQGAASPRGATGTGTTAVHSTQY